MLNSKEKPNNKQYIELKSCKKRARKKEKNDRTLDSSFKFIFQVRELFEDWLQHIFLAANLIVAVATSLELRVQLESFSEQNNS